jgi:hypothetical protein
VHTVAGKYFLLKTFPAVVRGIVTQMFVSRASCSGNSLAQYLTYHRPVYNRCHIENLIWPQLQGALLGRGYVT